VTHPLLFPLSDSVREGERLNKIDFASHFSFSKKREKGWLLERCGVLLTIFLFPSLTELERGNNSK